MLIKLEMGPTNNREYFDLISLILEKEKRIKELEGMVIGSEKDVGLTPSEQIRYAAIGIICYRRQVEIYIGILSSVYGVGEEDN